MISDNLPIAEIVMLLDKAVVQGFERGITNQFDLNSGQGRKFTLEGTLVCQDSNAEIAPCEYDLRRSPLVRPCSRFNRSSGLQRYSRTMGLGLPLIRLDSTMYQYLCPLDFFD